VTRFIVEIGSNHNRDLDRALALLEVAARAGAGAAKLQVFRVEDLFAPQALAAREDLCARREWELPLELIEPIARRCHDLDLELGATPFGLWAIEALEPYVDFFKVASYEVLWHESIGMLAATGRPLVISTGMATLQEIDAATAVARDAGCRDLRLLHCVSGYPTPPDQCNLAAIETLRERYGCPVGWSDHSARAQIVRRAVRRWGASDVELHLDLDGAGHEAGEHNWTPAALAALIAGLAAPGANGAEPADVSEAADSLEAVDLFEVDGDGVKRPMPVEKPDLAWRADPGDGLRPLGRYRDRLGGLRALPGADD
jgi:N-acetylneuraminate synthase